MVFKNELEFEIELARLLTTKGWGDGIIVNPTEQELIDNWAEILFKNNSGIDRLNDIPLTNSEMDQVIEKLKILKTPIAINGMIKSKSIDIKRDNPKDTLHFGKEVSLKIYDPKEIAAGQSIYQIVRQPKFAKKNKILNDRRGDIMLLINGMPVFHIELKRSGVPISNATNQIKKYMHENVFTGLFSLVQIFVAMTPDEMLYFANPGQADKFNQDYFFKWANFDNEPVNDYMNIASRVLSIPMAHQLIGFYTVADNSDGVLKVMRSYQYYAANAISDKVSKTKWNDKNQLGGFVWHTTGSGKTMTSFKSAQLIANSGDADKVVFLTDRIELGTQSLKEYRGFAEDADSVGDTEDTNVLITKLKNTGTADILIVTSIQKMSNIKENAENIILDDIKLINKKRLVFIVDEAHRSTFGDMLRTIKNTFPKAIFFGFTGTPIFDENQKKMSTTSDIFGNELHRYVIADGIRDKNVLGFDPYKVLTFKDKDVRTVVALEKAKAKTIEEVWADPEKTKVFTKFMDNKKVKMYGSFSTNGKFVKGIEDYIPNSQYRGVEHKNKVVEDITSSFEVLSRNYKFHAIFATSSIPEAIEYYRILKKVKPKIKATCLVDPNIDDRGNTEFKTDGLVEIISDYNKRYGQEYSLSTSDKLKKDISLRLAHKEYYRGIEKTPEKQIDLLIVVDQMLTGFDSKWVNTLYIDKKMEYANIIQAFSRTNRLFGHDKPFGTIRYYRKPHTMKENIDKAVKLYSGDKPVALFVQKLKYNLKQINAIYKDILNLFELAEVPNMEKLPNEIAEKKQFSKFFNELNMYIEASLIQGFNWLKREYTFIEDNKEEVITMLLDEPTYLTLLNRYKELILPRDSSPDNTDYVPYDLKGHLIEIDTGRIDADYMNNTFEKYLRVKNQDGASKKLIEDVQNELYKTFAMIPQEDQKYAEIFMRDLDKGVVCLDGTKTLRDYITEYKKNAHDDQIYRFAETFGLNEEKLRVMISYGLDESNIDEFGRYSKLINSVDKTKSKKYFEEKENKCLIQPRINQEMDKLLRKFVISGGFDI